MHTHSLIPLSPFVERISVLSAQVPRTHSLCITLEHMAPCRHAGPVLPSPLPCSGICDSEQTFRATGAAQCLQGVPKRSKDQLRDCLLPLAQSRLWRPYFFSYFVAFFFSTLYSPTLVIIVFTFFIESDILLQQNAALNALNSLTGRREFFPNMRELNFGMFKSFKIIN